MPEEKLLVLCVCILLTLVKRSLILDGTDQRETSYIKEETVLTKSMFVGDVCSGLRKNTLNEGHVFAVQGLFVDGF